MFDFLILKSVRLEYRFIYHILILNLFIMGGAVTKVFVNSFNGNKLICCNNVNKSDENEEYAKSEVHLEAERVSQRKNTHSVDGEQDVSDTKRTKNYIISTQNEGRNKEGFRYTKPSTASDCCTKCGYPREAL